MFCMRFRRRAGSDCTQETSRHMGTCRNVQDVLLSDASVQHRDIQKRVGQGLSPSWRRKKKGEHESELRRSEQNNNFSDILIVKIRRERGQVHRSKSRTAPQLLNKNHKKPQKLEDRGWQDVIPPTQAATRRGGEGRRRGLDIRRL